MEIAAAQTTKNAKTKRRFLPVSLALALTVAYAVIATTLITLRAVVDELAFLSTGWIVLLAVVPAATTADGKFRGLIEQRIVVLEFARRVLESN